MSSTGTGQTQNLAEFEQAVRDCFQAVSRLATALEAAELSGIDTGLDVAALGQLKRAANTLGDAFTFGLVASDLLEGDFGSASEEAAKFALGKLIEQGLDQILTDIARANFAGGPPIPLEDVATFNSIQGALANEAAGALANAAVETFWQNFENAVSNIGGEAELRRLIDTSSALTGIVGFVDNRNVDGYDDLGLGENFLFNSIAFNFVRFADQVIRDGQPFNFYGFLFGSDREGDIREIESIADFQRGNYFVVDLDKGADKIGGRWTLDEDLAAYARAYINRELDVDDYVFRGLASDRVDANIGGVRAAAIGDGGAFANISSNVRASFILADGGGNQEGSSGSDIMIGGSTAVSGRGNDLIVLDNDGGSFAAGEAGDDIILGSTRDDTLRGGRGDDTVEGGRGNDLVEGEQGNDILTGKGGNDTLLGGNGRDTIEGGEGSDSIDGGDGDDQIYGAELTNDTSGGNTIAGGDGDDTVFGGESGDTIEGGTGGDSLYGEGGGDTIVGGDGDDTLSGGDESGGDDGSDDTLEGGAGSDTYLASNGDTVNDSDGQGTVMFDGITLAGGTYEPEDSCDDEPGNDNESDENKEYEGENGEIYRKSGSGLEVTYNGATLTIENWRDGQLGITLEDEDPGDGDDCDDPPDDFGSPLTLDLDGDGVSLLALGQSAVFFDIDRDGVRERTGWVAPTDGLLAVDRNANGVIDGADELFGYGETFSSRLGQAPDTGLLQGPGGLDIRFESGFDQLAVFDTDNSGAVDASDLLFPTLRVWRDLNSDGISQAGELISLTEAGVASLSLDAVRGFETREGNLVTDVATLTTTGGETRELLDVWFQFDQYDTRFETPEGLDPALDLLPDLRAAGQVAPLKLAMAENADLRALVEDLTALTPADLGQVSPLVERVLYVWAGVGDPDRATGRGSYADRRATEVMETFADTPFAQWSGPAPRPQAGGVLTDQFQALAQSVAAKLVAQTALGQTLFPELTYENDQFLILADGTNSSDVLQRLIDSAPAEVYAALAHYQAGIRLLDFVYLSFADVAAAGDGGAGYRAAVEATLSAAGIGLSYDEILSARIGGSGDDSFLTESFSGLQYGNVIPVVSGGLGDDDITLGGNRQIVYWGSGQGDDTVTLDPFAAQGWNFTPRVELRLTDLTRNDIDFQRTGSDLSSDAAIVILATGETLTIRDLLAGNASPSGSLVFADGTTLSFGDFADIIAGLAQTGTDGDDVIFQRGGLTVDGGAGDDLLRGAPGDTEYVFGIGSGNDRIEDDSVGLNRVVFGPGIGFADLDFVRDKFRPADLAITIVATGETLRIPGQFGSTGPVIAEFVFESDPPLTAGAVESLFRSDGPGDDVVFGTAEDDFFGGNTGDDEIIGFDGADRYTWRPGDGQDIIDDRGSNRTRTDEDGNVFVIDRDRLFIDVAFADLEITEQGSSLVFFDPVSGGGVTVRPGIEEFDFDDVSDLTAADVRVLSQFAGAFDIVGTSNDDILPGTEDPDGILGLSGNDEITGLGGPDRIEGNEGDDSIAGGAGNDSIAGGQGVDVLEGGPGDDLIYGGDEGDVSSSLRRPNTLDGGDGNDELNGGWEDDVFFGGAGNDIIRGDFGEDTFTGGPGDDVMVDRDDDSTYFYALGDGHDQIFDDGSRFETDVLEFGPGILPTDLVFSFVQVDGTQFSDYFGFERDQWAIRADIALPAGGSVTFTGNQFDPVGSLDFLRFDGGESLSLAQIEAIVRAATDEDQLLVGRTGSSDDILAGGGGNDTLVGNFGSQTFLFGIGDGQDVILGTPPQTFGSETQTLTLGTGITPDNITIGRGGDGEEDLIVTLATGDSITVVGQYQSVQDTSFNDSGLIAGSYIDRITFVDDPAATLDADAIRAATKVATPGDDVEIGSNVDDVFETSAGNDEQRGGRGSDEYSFGIGSGMDVIVELADDLLYLPDTFDFEGGPLDLAALRETDTLTFGAGITPDNITVSIVGDALADVRIEIDGAPDSLIIQNQAFPMANWGRATKEFGGFFGPPPPPGVEEPALGPNGEVSEAYWLANAAADYGPEPLFQAGVEVFVFDDGTTLTREEFLDLVGRIENEGDNTIRTDDTGGTLDGGPGADSLLGGTGDDTYILEIGSFNDVASDAGGFDDVAFGAGITPELVAFSRVGENGEDLLVEIGGETRNAVLIEGQFADDGREIEEFRTDDGQVFRAEDIRRLLLQEDSTEGNDVILGFEDDDVIDARGGDDVIRPLGGNDLVDGGTGRDTAEFRGPRSEYEITTEGSFTVVTDLTGRDGVTRLLNVESLVFLGDGTAPPEVEDLVANSAPVAASVALTGREDTVLVVSPATLLAGASDPDGAAPTLAAVGNAMGGAVGIDGAGRVVFTPDADLTGPASFEFTVTDTGGLTATATASIDLAPVNDAPVAADDVATGTEDEVLVIDSAEILANDTDIDGDSLTVTDVTADSGAVVLDGGVIRFTPEAEFSGQVTLGYTVSDGGATDTAEIAVTIDPVNDAPEPADDETTALEDTQLVIAAADLLFNDEDIDGDALTVTGVDMAQNGTVALNGATIVFTPAADYNGPASFRYTVQDPGGLTASAIVTVEVAPDNDAPVGTDDSGFSTGAGVPVTLAAAALLANDSDVDGDALVLADLVGATGGTADLDADGDVVFTPDAGFQGTASVTYVLADPGGLEATATVEIAVTADNRAPEVAAPLPDVSVDEDNGVAIAVPAGTFADPDGDALTLTARQAGGADLPDWLVFDGQDFAGTPPLDFNGALDLEVVASDGELQATSGFTLTIQPVNDDPVALDDSGFEVTAGETLTIDPAALLANDSDVDGDALTVASVAPGMGGTVALGAGGITFTADPAFQGTASFGYTVTDGNGGSAAAEVSVTVEGAGTDPYADYARGTDGPDLLFGRVFAENLIFGAGGNDRIVGGFRDDGLAGGDGRDILFGLTGDDLLEGNAGRDILVGGFGDDVIVGGTGNDKLFGGFGDDRFEFQAGDGHDTIFDFGTGLFGIFGLGDDVLVLDVDGVDSAAAALALAVEDGSDVVFDFGGGDGLRLVGTRLAHLGLENFEIA